MNVAASVKDADLNGWRTVTGSLICLSLGVSCLVFYCFSVFIPSLQEGFGWSRTEISLGLSVASLSTVAVMPFLGNILDRYGARAPLLLSVIALSALFISMALLDTSRSLLHFYAMFILLPLLGAGTQPVVFSRAIVGWFTKGRGLALGIALSGAGVGAMLLPLVVSSVITDHGWLGGYIALGMVSFLVAFPSAYFLIKERISEDALLKKTNLSDRNIDLNFKDIIRNSVVRPLLASFFLLGITLTGLLGHIVPISLDSGLDTPSAALISSVFGVAVIFGRIISGFLMDRYSPPVVGFAFLLCPALGALLFAYGSGFVVFVAAAALCGLAMGSEFSMLGLFVSRLFPLSSYGRYYAIIYASFLLGGVAGPLVLALSVDYFGSYRWGLTLLSAVTLAGAWLILNFRRFSQFSANVA